MKVLITGSEKGIGKACKNIFLKNGFEVFGIDILSDIAIDVCDRDLLRDYIKHIGKIDIVINCAAIQDVCPFENISFSNWDKVINVNLTGYFNIIKIASEYMSSGCILNIGSVHSVLPRMNKYSYDVSKAGIRALTQEAALALASKNIRVNCLEIGACNTPMNNCFSDIKIYEEAKSKTVMNVILEPDDVAKVVYELTQDTFKYMTGSIVTYDAGRTLNQ